MHPTLKVESMETRAEKAQDNKNHSAAYQAYQKKSSAEASHGLGNDRPQARRQQQLRDMANNSAQVSQLMAFQVMANQRTADHPLRHNAPVSEGAVAQLAHYTSGGPVYMDDDDPTSLVDDNFDETIKGQLTPQTADSDVEAAVTAGTNIDVVLWRSTTAASVAAIQAAGSAGGAAAEDDVAAPGHDVQQDQIAVGGVTPEYTASNEVTGFSWRHWLVVVRINTRYLARGSGSESGWICSPAAPVEVLDTVDRTMGLPEPAGLGAA
jgi:hypothetical protein